MFIDDDPESEERFRAEPESYPAEILRLAVRDFSKIAGPCPSCGRKPRAYVQPRTRYVSVGCYGTECIDRWSIGPDASLLEALRKPDAYTEVLALFLRVWSGLKK